MQECALERCSCHQQLNSGCPILIFWFSACVHKQMYVGMHSGTSHVVSTIDHEIQMLPALQELASLAQQQLCWSAVRRAMPRSRLHCQKQKDHSLHLSAAALLEYIPHHTLPLCSTWHEQSEGYKSVTKASYQKGNVALEIQ